MQASKFKIISFTQKLDAVKSSLVISSPPSTLATCTQSVSMHDRVTTAILQGVLLQFTTLQTSIELKFTCFPRDNSIS